MHLLESRFDRCLVSSKIDPEYHQMHSKTRQEKKEQFIKKMSNEGE